MKERSTDTASTVSDFSEQWTHFTQNEGYFASEEILQDHFGDLLNLSDLTGKRVCEIGSGNGRFLKIMAKYAREVVGVEPSNAIEVSRKFTADVTSISYVNAQIEELSDTSASPGQPNLKDFDYVFCLGVLHHLPNPVDALKTMRAMLAPNGQLVVWVYGREGNELYLFLLRIMRSVTVHLPHRLLVWLSHLLALFMKVYGLLCRYIPLPLHKYMNNVLSKCNYHILTMNIYDQLNPRIANYWSRKDLEDLFRQVGVPDVRLYHRHGYSWTAIGLRSSHS